MKLSSNKCHLFKIYEIVVFSMNEVHVISLTIRMASKVE